MESCDGDNCTGIKLLKKDMEHHGEAVSEATLSIRECVEDLKKSAIETQVIRSIIHEQNKRLEEGMHRFEDHETRLRKAEIVTDVNRSSILRVWWWLGSISAAILGFIAYLLRTVLPS